VWYRRGWCFGIAVCLVAVHVNSFVKKMLVMFLKKKKKKKTYQASRGPATPAPAAAAVTAPCGCTVVLASM